MFFLLIPAIDYLPARSKKALQIGCRTPEHCAEWGQGQEWRTIWNI